MDIDFLDRASKITPLLVRLYDGQKLSALAYKKDPESRAELGNIITELLDLDLTNREKELVADILVELVRQAETDIRAALSEKLALMDNVPLRLVVRLANDEITVARPVLEYSTALGDVDLLYIIKSTGADHWRAIAARKVLGESVINALADTKDIDTAVTLTKNLDIRLTEHALGVLSDIAQGRDILAQPLLRREEVSDELAGALYAHVGEHLKHYIRQNYPVMAQQVSDAVDEAVMEFAQDAQAWQPEEDAYLPDEVILEMAEEARNRGILNEKLMLAALHRRQIRVFIAHFSKFCGIRPEIIRDILRQKSGQGLALLCRAHDIQKPDFISFYLLSNPVRGSAKMTDIKDLSRAVEYYTRIRKETALEIIQERHDKRL